MFVVSIDAKVLASVLRDANCYLTVQRDGHKVRG